MSMHPNLSFDQAPPIAVPFRFLLTAPLFGLLAGLLLAWLGPAVFESRWTPGALALTHLLSVGFMLQAMCGALLQFVPVVTGGNVWQPRLLAAVLHPLLILAAALLVLAFLLGRPELFQLAVPLFAMTLGAFVVIVTTALFRSPASGRTIYTLRLALPSLGVTLLLGMALAGKLGWPDGWFSDWSLPVLVNVHAGWGLGGWALLLLVGVSYQVVPMFQLTPPFPVWLTRLMPAGLLVLLTLWSLQLIPLEGGMLAGVVLLSVYALVTLWLQHKRRRRLIDTTFLFWRVAMFAMLAFSASWLAGAAWPVLAEHPRMALWLGVLILPGVFVSVINGMLYKIVPFLIWLHLQRLGNLKELPPNIKQIISERTMRGQLWLHCAALVLLLGGVAWPLLAHVAGAVFALSCAWLEWNLYGALRTYLVFKERTLKDQTRAGVSFHAP